MNIINKPIRINVNAAIIRDDQILVIEFSDENGIHFNLPGGGVEIGEPLEVAISRECLEEANAIISVGRVLLIWEYVPVIHENKYGSTQKVGIIFECKLEQGVEPSLPTTPDANQVGVKWIPLSTLKEAPSLNRPPIFPTIEKELLLALSNPFVPVQLISRA